MESSSLRNTWELRNMLYDTFRSQIILRFKIPANVSPYIQHHCSLKVNNSLLYYILSPLLVFVVAITSQPKDLEIALSVNLMSRPHYQYSPLFKTAKWPLRLLNLHPGVPGDALCCSIGYTALDQLYITSFDALLYVGLSRRRTECHLRI